uniref:Uncharacterized protein n=1 Tax=Chromera velia CCMP2878 TaxID=1169474 RepID=A0A0G4G438_9ALVE|eukprot:Cvel_20101.t1-p1 / transcript=Cvel_20101.t1 / gene=Cvel_20101 / organism=Chromera_velia_CCMP2878 / gene_product=hypothetical protein / transcript_product=hypothetical protein / location=Cvel_scaffold1780:2574-7941(+) / protein_length=1179 / sequence_SO=supercontig / SO=protein_coding / is_pseudo=false
MRSRTLQCRKFFQLLWLRFLNSPLIRSASRRCGRDCVVFSVLLITGVSLLALVCALLSPHLPSVLRDRSRWYLASSSDWVASCEKAPQGCVCFASSEFGCVHVDVENSGFEMVQDAVDLQKMGVDVLLLVVPGEEFEAPSVDFCPVQGAAKGLEGKVEHVGALTEEALAGGFSVSRGAFALFSWLRAHPHACGILHVPAKGGLGVFAAQGKRAGLLPGTHVNVQADCTELSSMLSYGEPERVERLAAVAQERLAVQYSDSLIEGYPTGIVGGAAVFPGLPSPLPQVSGDGMQISGSPWILPRDTVVVPPGFSLVSRLFLLGRSLSHRAEKAGAGEKLGGGPGTIRHVIFMGSLTERGGFLLFVEAMYRVVQRRKGSLESVTIVGNFEGSEAEKAAATRDHDLFFRMAKWNGVHRVTNLHVSRTLEGEMPSSDGGKRVAHSGAAAFLDVLLREDLRRDSIVVVPSLVDCGGELILAALMARLPFIALDTPSTREIMKSLPLKPSRFPQHSTQHDASHSDSSAAAWSDLFSRMLFSVDSEDLADLLSDLLERGVQDLPTPLDSDELAPLTLFSKQAGALSRRRTEHLLHWHRSRLPPPPPSHRRTGGSRHNRQRVQEKEKEKEGGSHKSMPHTADPRVAMTARLPHIEKKDGHHHHQHHHRQPEQSDVSSLRDRDGSESSVGHYREDGQSERRRRLAESPGKGKGDREGDKMQRDPQSSRETDDGVEPLSHSQQAFRDAPTETPMHRPPSPADNGRSDDPGGKGGFAADLSVVVSFCASAGRLMAALASLSSTDTVRVNEEEVRGGGEESHEGPIPLDFFQNSSAAAAGVSPPPQSLTHTRKEKKSLYINVEVLLLPLCPSQLTCASEGISSVVSQRRHTRCLTQQQTEPNRAEDTLDAFAHSGTVINTSLSQASADLVFFLDAEAGEVMSEGALGTLKTAAASVAPSVAVLTFLRERVRGPQRQVEGLPVGAATELFHVANVFGSHALYRRSALRALFGDEKNVFRGHLESVRRLAFAPPRESWAQFSACARWELHARAAFRSALLFVPAVAVTVGGVVGEGGKDAGETEERQKRAEELAAFLHEGIEGSNVTELKCVPHVIGGTLQALSREPASPPEPVDRMSPTEVRPQSSTSFPQDALQSIAISLWHASASFRQHEGAAGASVIDPLLPRKNIGIGT